MRILILTLVLLFMACPVYALDIERINKDFHEQTGIEPIQTEPAEPVHEYNFWKGKFDLWTKEDTKYQIGCVVIQWIDLQKTSIDIEHGGYEWGLAKEFIGEYPTNEQLVSFFTSTTILQFGIAYILPKKYRRIWQIGTATIQLWYIGNSRGTQMLFNF